mgnify:CR=1 FL=1
MSKRLGSPGRGPAKTKSPPETSNPTSVDSMEVRSAPPQPAQSGVLDHIMSAPRGDYLPGILGSLRGEPAEAVAGQAGLLTTPDMPGSELMEALGEDPYSDFMTSPIHTFRF